MHTWDIAVMDDSAAGVPADTAELIIDNLAALVERAGRPVPGPVTVDVHPQAPDRRLRLELTADGARLSPLAPDSPSHRRGSVPAG